MAVIIEDGSEGLEEAVAFEGEDWGIGDSVSGGEEERLLTGRGGSVVATKDGLSTEALYCACWRRWEEGGLDGMGGERRGRVFGQLVDECESATRSCGK